KNDRPYGFDGRFGWQLDRAGFPAPLPQRLREKLLIPAWVRDGWWLNKNAPFVFAVLPEETNENQVALSLKLERGLVGAKIFIDRKTWLPQTLIVEYERGPYTLDFIDYQETIGIRFPQRIKVNYRGSDSEFKVRSIAELKPTADNPFRTPALPNDTTFDNALPAELTIAQGVPFSDSSPGHFYVRPLIDGKDLGWFHFDSGSDTMQIDSKLADDLKMPVLGSSRTQGADGRVTEVTIRQGKTFQLGRMVYKDPIFVASDMSGKNAPPGEKRAGFIGYPFFARAVVEVKSGGKNIAVYEPKSYKLNKGKWQELFYIDLTPAVVCRLEGDREGLFQIDTGYTGTVTFYDKFIAEQKLLEGRKIKDETGIGSGGTYKLVSGEIEWFELAGYRFDNPRAGFRVSGLSREGGAGVVGREFLSVFTVIFNYPERRIAFIR
ncbi:MAG: retropepsin-like aspartic protease, partial [Pyrinomonadaceae bacterium]